MELNIILSWFLVLEIIGFITIPITTLLFNKLSDKGYSASKLFGILLLTYFSYIFSRFKILDFTFWTILLSFFILALISFFLLLSKFNNEIISAIKSLEFRKTAIKSEIFFIIAFIFFLGVRAYVPDIKGGETFYDLAYINSLIRTEKFPPIHPWFSQVSLENYYYFGHLMIATLSKFSGISAAYSYNLGLITIMALTCILTFGLTFNLTKKSFYSIIAVFLVAFSGNIFSLLQVVNYIFPDFNVYVKFYEPPKYGDFFQKALDYNWWHPSRIIPWAIHEMPYWTFIWGDLHGHFVAIPLRILLILFLLNLFLSKEKKENSGFKIFGENFIEKIFKIFSLSIVLGFIFPTNIYDFPFLALFVGIMFFVHNFLTLEKISLGKIILKSVFFPLIITFIIVSLSLLLYSPVVFQLLQHIQDPIIKILPHEENSLLNTGVPNSIREEVFKTSLYHFSLIFSLQIFLIFLFILKLFYDSFVKGVKYMSGLFVICLAIYFVFLLSVFLNYFPRIEQFYSSIKISFSLESLLYDFQLLIILIPIILSSIFFIFRKEIDENKKFVFLLILFGALTALISELVNVEGRYVFMNKIYGEIYIFWGISSAYILYSFGRKFIISWKYLPLTFFTIFLLLSYSIFPILTTIQKTHLFTPSYGRKFLTLDGYDWLEREGHSSDYEAIKWLNKNVKGVPIILEVPGRDYQYTSRVSVFTGLPTVLGWSDHMEDHLAISRENIEKISQEVDKIYDTTNNEIALNLIKKYNVQYIYIGELEKEYKNVFIHGNIIENKEYSKEGLEKFDKFSENYEKIYDNKDVQIYKIKT